MEYLENLELSEAAKCTFIVEDGHKAVGIRYKRELSYAPEIWVLGEKAVRDKIIVIAQLKNIPVVKNLALVSAIYNEKLTHIPEETYETVIDILKKLKEQNKIKL